MFISNSETKSQNMSRQLKSSFFMLTAFLVFVCALLIKVPKKTIVNYLGQDFNSQVEENIVRMCHVLINIYFTICLNFIVTF